MPLSLRHRNIYDFEEDACRIMESHSSYINVNGIDTWTYKKMWLWLRAHIDFLQIIPTDGRPNGQYSLAEIEAITIKFCSLITQAKVQPVFSSDGIIKSIVVAHNVFQTKSQHHITLNGCLECISYDNWIQKGNNVTAAKTVLNPARVAGGLNVWILGFKNTYEYKPVVSAIQDNRNKPRKDGINLVNFDAKEFKEEVSELPRWKLSGINTKYIKQIAQLHGDQV